MNTIIVSALLAVSAGGALGWFLRRFYALREKDTAEQKANEIIGQAKQRAQDFLIKARDKGLATIEDAKKEEAQRRKEVQELQNRLEKRESIFDTKILEIENKQQKLQEKAQEVEGVKKEIEEIRVQQVAKLETIADMNREQAKELLLSNVEEMAKEDLYVRMRKLEQVSDDEWDTQATKHLSLAMERCASSHSAESTKTVVELPSDEMKGRIIGKEGRNIKRIEDLTGVEIIVDDTPGVVVISGFSPIRRHLAKRTLEKLISDGRIHPTRIEEVIEETKKELAKDIYKAGEDGLYEVGVTGFPPKLIQLLGRLKYRTSYGQNVLRHSIEVAHIAGMLADELGADVTLAKKGGLFHDIGKAVDHEVQGTHPKLGEEIGKKFDLQGPIIDAIRGHHDDHPEQFLTLIVKVADAISGARYGARKDTYERYVQRLEEIEKVVMAFPGTERAYAIQAGREVRVFVKPSEVDDWGAVKLARDIAKKIEAELRYPGEIKIMLIREQRITEYAR